MRLSTSKSALLAVGVILLLSVSTITPVAAQTSGQVFGEPTIEVSTPTKEFKPGTQAELRLTLTNRGVIDQGGPSRYEDRVTTARGVIVEAKAGSTPIEVNTGSIGVGNVPTGTTSVDPISISVSENADPGLYQVPIDISYEYTRLVEFDSFGAEYVDSSRSRTKYVTVRVRDDARFRVVNITNDAQIGDSGILSVELENTGENTATRADVELTAPSGALTFSGGTSSTARIDELAPGERATVTYDVEFAAGSAVRSYAVTGGVTFKDPEGITRTDESISFGFVPIDEQQFSVDNVSTDLRVGENGDLVGTVINEGPEPAQNVVVRYVDESPNIVPVEDAVAVGTLQPGERADFRLPLEVNTEAEAVGRVADLSIRYRNDENERREYDEVEAVYTIGPEREEFSVEIDDQEIEAGSTATVDVTVTNNLDEPVSNIEARLFTDDPLSSDDDEAFAALLEPGESTTMTFTLSAAGGATLKTYPVSLDFRYDDADGDSQLSDTFRAAVTLTEGSSGLPFGTILVAVIVIGALTGGIVYYRRRN